MFKISDMKITMYETDGKILGVRKTEQGFKVSIIEGAKEVFIILDSQDVASFANDIIQLERSPAEQKQEE